MPPGTNVFDQSVTHSAPICHDLGEEIEPSIIAPDHLTAQGHLISRMSKRHHFILKYPIYWVQGRVRVHSPPNFLQDKAWSLTHYPSPPWKDPLSQLKASNDNPPNPCASEQPQSLRQRSPTYHMCCLQYSGNVYCHTFARSWGRPPSLPSKTLSSIALPAIRWYCLHHTWPLYASRHGNHPWVFLLG